MSLPCAILETDTSFATMTKKPSEAERVPKSCALVGQWCGFATMHVRQSTELRRATLRLRKSNNARQLAVGLAQMSDVLCLGSHLMTRMHQERPPRHDVCPEWKRRINIANLPRSVIAWLQWLKQKSIAKVCEQWLGPGQKSLKRRNREKHRARLSWQIAREYAA